MFHSIELDEFGLQNAGLINEKSELLKILRHLDEIGSLFKPEPSDAILLESAYKSLSDTKELFSGQALIGVETALTTVKQLERKYSVVIANPPYLGSGNMNSQLNAWLKEHYPDERNDLCTCFINRGLTFVEHGGYLGMITASAWMFISSFEKMRAKLLRNNAILSMIQQSTHGFPSVTVPSTMFVLRQNASMRVGSYIRLEDFDRPQWQQPKAYEAIHNHDRYWFYTADAEAFMDIPSMPIAYWASESMLAAFKSGTSFGDLGKPKAGITTGDNEAFIRLWWEVSFETISFDTKDVDSINDSFVWYPCDKGGDFRKWYGNQENLLGFNSAMQAEMQTRSGYRPVNLSLQFRESITWSYISSGVNAFRYSGTGRLFDHSGISAFPPANLNYILGFMNSSTAYQFLGIFSSNLRNDAGNLAKVPVVYKERDMTPVDDCIRLCKEDYDLFETSWDYTTHPLIRRFSTIQAAAASFSQEARHRFDSLKKKEEELNLTFARIYGMENEVPITVPEDKISVRLFNQDREIRSLISYAIGCMFGRYSLDIGGLILADQGSTVENYLAKIPSPSFMPDEDGILPITEEEWFEDDIVTEFWCWLKAAFGEEHFDENLAYIEETLGCKLREYFIKGKKSAFYDDHCKTYSVTGSGKRPIYWMFSSPKSSFNCLVYLHRYDDRTVSNILTDYVRELRRKLEIQARSLEASDIARDRTRADKYHDMIDELNDWERDVLYPMAQRHIKIDLDDGVRHNYKLFPGALRKVPGLS